MSFNSSFSFEDAELFNSGGTCISSAPVKVVDPQAKPSLTVEGSVKDCAEPPIKAKDCVALPIKVGCEETDSGPGAHHDATPLTDASVPSDKYKPSYASLDDILSPRYWNETQISFTDVEVDCTCEESYNSADLYHDAVTFADTSVPSDKLAPFKGSLDDMLFPRYQNDTGITFTDVEVEEDGPRTALLALVDELLENFADYFFQERLRDLMVDACRRQNKPHNERLRSVAGRADLAREVQAEVLPKYGFLGSQTGVEAMYLALNPYLNEELMQKRMIATDDLLWMPPGTTVSDCRFAAAIMTPKSVRP